MYKRSITTSGNSNWQADAYLIELIHLYAPRSILDVGVGKWAKIGNLVRRSYDEWTAIHYNQYPVFLAGIEGHLDNYDYIKDNSPNIYDSLIYADALQTLKDIDRCIDPFRDGEKYLRMEHANKNKYTYHTNFDVIVFGDILEHFSMTDALEIVHMYSICNRALIIQLPLGEYPQEVEVNPLETHRSTWGYEDIMKLKPAGLRKFTDFVGRDFVVFAIPKF